MAMNDISSHEHVWIFHGQGTQFASAVFASTDDGLAWAARHRVTGILSRYPVGDGCYDIAVREGQFRPSKDHHGTPEHIARFGPGPHHVHITDGATD
ncbi:hypothetical protein STSO111631_00685 [Stackebrandtia soli]